VVLICRGEVACSGLRGGGAGVVSNRLVAQSAEMGTLPQLYAAVDPGAESGRFYGPDEFGELRGDPAEVQPTAGGRLSYEELKIIPNGRG
jgi:hypothetical protein